MRKTKAELGTLPMTTAYLKKRKKQKKESRPTKRSQRVFVQYRRGRELGELAVERGVDD